MAKISKENRLRNIVCRGLEQLQEHLSYGQSNIVSKFKMLDMAVSTASLSNIKTGKPTGLLVLNTAAKGMEVLLQRELDMGFHVETQEFRPLNTPSWVADIVAEKHQDPAQSAFKVHADGRVSLKQKTDFFADAKQEVIEVGVRLNSLSNYFISQNEQAYTNHILRLLQKGVKVKAYLLDPDSQEARIYFEDRAQELPSEKDSISETKKVIERLKVLSLKFEAMNLAGSFEIYLYKHIPVCLFFVVDGATAQGKMMVSPYLYGVRRANCPVLEFTRKDQPVVFRSHFDSMQRFIDGAQKLS